MAAPAGAGAVTAAPGRRRCLWSVLAAALGLRECGGPGGALGRGGSGRARPSWGSGPCAPAPRRGPGAACALGAGDPGGAQRGPRPAAARRCGASPSGSRSPRAGERGAYLPGPGGRGERPCSALPPGPLRSPRGAGRQARLGPGAGTRAPRPAPLGSGRFFISGAFVVGSFSCFVLRCKFHFECSPIRFQSLRDGRVPGSHVSHLWGLQSTGKKFPLCWVRMQSLGTAEKTGQSLIIPDGVTLVSQNLGR